MAAVLARAKSLDCNRRALRPRRLPRAELINGAAKPRARCSIAATRTRPSASPWPKPRRWACRRWCSRSAPRPERIDRRRHRRSSPSMTRALPPRRSRLLARRRAVAAEASGGAGAPARLELGRGRAHASRRSLAMTRLAPGDGGPGAWRRRGVLRAARGGAATRRRGAALAIRRDAPRARAPCAAPDCEVIELPFGGPLDFATRPRLRRALAELPPARRADLDEPRGNRALPARRFRACRRLGGYYDLKYYRSCDHLIANTRDIDRYIVRRGLAGGARALSAEFRRPPSAPAPVSRSELRHARGCAARAGAGPAPSQQGLRYPARSAWRARRAFIFGSPARAPSAMRSQQHAAALGIAGPRALPRLARGRPGAAGGVPTCWLSPSRHRAPGQCRASKPGRRACRSSRPPARARAR